jgi:hypothetical protein
MDDGGRQGKRSTLNFQRSTFKEGTFELNVES